MGLFRKGNAGPAPSRLYFATDLHGSEVCFRKFLHASDAYRATTVIMGGDCTGKMLVPVVAGGDAYRCTWHGEQLSFGDDNGELAAVEKQINDAGFYAARLSEEEYAHLSADPAAMHERFSREMCDRLEQWCELASERLGDSEVRMIASPGNDDEFEIDQVLEDAPFVEPGQDQVIRIGAHEMISICWSNPTPWDTPRECAEEELAAKIDAAAAGIEDMANAIFNLHVPPYGTGLDEAPKLDAEQRMEAAGAMAAVGSTAVRDAILNYQPLLSLHGHIHESKGVQKLGRTTCINPGSVYGEGSLLGVTVDLTDQRVASYSLTAG
ncbi:MAG: metallophosphoesterase [Solirubrobacterales bacterium]